MKEKTANIDILEEKIKIIESLCTDDCINKETVIKPFKYAISNLIAENKELKEENEGLKTKLDTLIEKYKELKEEKEKNNELEKYAKWHIEHLTEDIVDYIDDDKEGNASLIGELKEEREHWKDIIRINNNEKTYIGYKNY